MTSDLGTAASREAMAQAGVRPGDIDLIVCATSTPDETFPATATRIQARLGVGQGAAFDVQAVRSGFVYGLAVADNFLRSEEHTSELQSLMRISYAVFCLKKKTTTAQNTPT